MFCLFSGTGLYSKAILELTISTTSSLTLNAMSHINYPDSLKIWNLKRKWCNGYIILSEMPGSSLVMTFLNFVRHKGIKIKTSCLNNLINDASTANLLFNESNSEDMTLPILSNIMLLVHSGSSSLHSSSGTSCLCALMELPSFPPQKQTQN